MVRLQLPPRFVKTKLKPSGLLSCDLFERLLKSVRYQPDLIDWSPGQKTPARKFGFAMASSEVGKEKKERKSGVDLNCAVVSALFSGYPHRWTAWKPVAASSCVPPAWTLAVPRMIAGFSPMGPTANPVFSGPGGRLIRATSTRRFCML